MDTERNRQIVLAGDAGAGKKKRGKMSDAVSESGRWMKKGTRTDSEEDKQERKEGPGKKKRGLGGIYIETSVSHYRQICV